MNKIYIKLLGKFEVLDHLGEPVAIPGRKQQALLAYLAAHYNQGVSREQIMGLFWGDRYQDQARQSLRQSISKLRKLLTFEGKCGLESSQETIRVDASCVAVDLEKFVSLAKKHDTGDNAQALSLFKNPLLEGFSGGGVEFENWLVTERMRYNELAFPLFERHATDLIKSEQRSNAVELAQRLVSLDPLREVSHRLVMRIFAQSGQRSAAIKQFNTCRDILRQELGVEPDAETLQLLEDIKSPGSIQAIPTTKPTPSIEPDQITPNAKVSIAILAFQTVGASGNLPFFASGLSEDILIGLTKYRWLDVIAYNPGREENLKIADQRQAVRGREILYSVEGSVRQIGNQIRITVQLVEMASGKYAWVQRFDRHTDDLFQVQDELAETISASIETELVSFEGNKARTRNKDEMGAWDCYHLGLATQYEFSLESNARAQALFRKAIELDPGFGMAYARLSYAMVLSAIYFEADPNSGLLDEALELAQKATRLDDQDAIARFALGRAHLARGEYELSVFELKHAIELNPSLAQAHCGLGDSLAYMGDAKNAIPCFEEAVRLSPHDPHRWAFSMYGAIANIFAGDFDKAVDWAQTAVRIPNSHYWANAALVSALGHKGDHSGSKQAVDQLLALKPNFDCSFARDSLFFLNDKAQIETYVEGLQKAGIA